MMTDYFAMRDSPFFTTDWWRGEVREGWKLRNHHHPLIRNRNRGRVRWALRILRKRKEQGR